MRSFFFCFASGGKEGAHHEDQESGFVAGASSCAAAGSFFHGRSGLPSTMEAYLAAANRRSLRRFTYLA